jgi:hypothetical protein
MAKSDLKQLALLGAQARIRQLEAEAQELLRMFPQLKGGAKLLTQSGARADVAKPKRRFSAEGKKSISEGMRKYWARRKAKVKTTRSERPAS